MRADPTLTAHTAGIMLDAATTLADLTGPAMSTLDLADDAFSGLAAGPRLADAHRGSADALESLVSRVRQVLEGDGDRLYQLAFGLRALEQRVSQRVGSSNVAHTSGRRAGR